MIKVISSKKSMLVQTHLIKELDHFLTKSKEITKLGLMNFLLSKIIDFN